MVKNRGPPGGGDWLEASACSKNRGQMRAGRSGTYSMQASVACYRHTL